MIDDHTLARLGAIGRALPTADDFRPVTPESCPRCYDRVWIAPYVDGTATAYCIGCGWSRRIDMEGNDVED